MTIKSIHKVFQTMLFMLLASLNLSLIIGCHPICQKMVLLQRNSVKTYSMFLMKYNKEDRSDVKVCDNQEGYNLGGGSVVNGERVIDLEYWNTIFKIFF